MLHKWMPWNVMWMVSQLLQPQNQIAGQWFFYSHILSFLLTSFRSFINIYHEKFYYFAVFPAFLVTLKDIAPLRTPSDEVFQLLLCSILLQVLNCAAVWGSLSCFSFQNSPHIEFWGPVVVPCSSSAMPFVLCRTWFCMDVHGRHIFV